MRKCKIDFGEREGRWRRITGLSSKSSTASDRTLAEASGRGNHVKDSVWICTANKVATGDLKAQANL